MKKSLMFLLITIGFHSIGIGQSKSEQKRIARDHIENIKKGILMVRLDFKKEKIDFLKKQGQTKRAEIVEKRWESRRKEIIAAFKENYTFSKYCFFFEGDSEAIVKNRNFTKAFKDLGITPCEYSSELPIYLLLLEQDKYDINLNGPPHFYFYEIKNGKAALLDDYFPHDFLAIRYLFLRLKRVDNISACIDRINYTLETY